MAKIRKNLSDEDMLKGFSEELSFENGIYSEEKTTARMKLKAKAPAPEKEKKVEKRAAASPRCSRTFKPFPFGNQHGMVEK